MFSTNKVKFLVDLSAKNLAVFTKTLESLNFVNSQIEKETEIRLKEVEELNAAYDKNQKIITKIEDIIS